MKKKVIIYNYKANSSVFWKVVKGLTSFIWCNAEVPMILVLMILVLIG